MTLNASAANGSSVAAWRTRSCSVRGSRPWTAGTSSGLGRLGRDVADLHLRPEVVDPRDAAQLDEVDDAAVVLLGPDRHLHRDGHGAEAVTHRLNGLEEVRAGAVHLVDERDPGHGVLVG